MPEELDYYQDKQGIYTKNKDGSRKYLTPKELEGFDVVEATPYPSLNTPEPRSQGSTTERVIQNAITTPFRLAKEAVEGVGSIYGALQDPNSVPTREDFRVPDVGAFLENLKSGKFEQQGRETFGGLGEILGRGIENKVRDYTTKEGWINNPLQLAVDALTLFPETILGKATGFRQIPGVLNKLKDNAILEHFGPQLNDLRFKMEGFAPHGASNLAESTVEDVIKASGKYGAAPPTVGQMSGNPLALQTEAQNLKGSTEVFKSQVEGTKKWAEDWLSGFTPTGKGGKKIGIYSDPTDVGGVMRDFAIAGYQNEFKKLTVAMTQDADDVVKYLGGISPNFATNLAGKSPEEVLQKSQELAGLARKGGKPDLSLERYNEFLKSSVGEVKRLGKDPQSRLLLNSRNEFADMMGKASKDPISEDIWRDPNYSKLVKEATVDKESLARFAAIPGIGNERAAQVMVFKMIDDSKTLEGVISPAQLYQNLTDPTNIKTMAAVMDPKQRAGTQVFAHAMKLYSRYDPTTLSRMAFQAQKTGAGSAVAGMGAALPLAFGGSFAQMRAGYSAANFAFLYLNSKVMSNVLLHPDGGWVLSRLINTPKTGPSLAGTGRSLLKIMGELNIPATFRLPNGEETTVNPSQVPIQGSPRVGVN